MRIGWFTLTRDIKTASARYRCFHMAWALQHEGVESVVYVKPALLIADLDKLDVVIIVKRLDQRVEDVVTAAKASGKAIFLDLCDDLLNPAQGAERSRLHRAVLDAIAPALTAVVTTNAAFSDQLRGYGVALPPVIEIPDLAETRAIFTAVGEAAAQMPARATEPSPPPVARPLEPPRAPTAHSSLLSRLFSRPATKTPRRIVWFGNHGGPHSNFGMLSLLAAAPALRRAAERHTIELVVVSNHAAKYEAFIPYIGVPSRYVAWSAEAVYDALDAADVALLTNGDDEFSAVKSANRPLQALACGVPAVTSGNRATRDLGDAVIIDDFTDGLLTYLGDARAAATAVDKGRALIERDFSPEANAQRWLSLLSLQRPGLSAPHPPLPAAAPGRLFLIAGAQATPAMLSAIRQTRAAGESVMILLGPEAATRAVADMLIAEALVPVMADAGEIRADDARWLRGAREVCIAAEQAEAATAVDLMALAQAFGAPVIRL